MSRPSLLIALSVVLAPGLLFAQETTVYKSKNADGTSVYTQIETRDAEVRRLASRDPAVAAQADAAAPKTDTQIACDRAQENLVLLDSGKVLQRDRDGDGQPENLTPDEMTSEREIAKRQVAAYCAQPED